MLVTAHPLDNADGACWMPNYSTNPNELLFDSECRVDKTIGYIDKYKRGIGVTLEKVPVFDVCITYNSTVQNVQQRYPVNTNDDINSCNVLLPDSIPMGTPVYCGNSEPSSGTVWGFLAAGRYKAVIVGTHKTNYVSVLCCQPHMQRATQFRKVGLMYIKKNDDVKSLVNTRKCSCTIG